MDHEYHASVFKESFVVFHLIKVTKGKKPPSFKIRSSFDQAEP